MVDSGSKKRLGQLDHNDDKTDGSAYRGVAVSWWATVHDGVDVTTVKGHVSHHCKRSTGHEDADVWDACGSGLRIAPAEEPQTLQISDSPAPLPQDTVLERAGAAVFLEPTVAQALNDQVLDVQLVVSDDGDQYHFAIVPQAAG